MSLRPVVFIPGFIATKLKFRPDNWTIFPPNPLDLLDGAKKRAIVSLLSSPKHNDPADEVQPVEPIRSVLAISKQADALYGVLANFGYDTSLESENFRAVGWDWRKAIDDDATRSALRKAIRGFSDRVVVLVHSAGGLVLRKLLEDEPELAAHIHEIVAFGVPWAGTPIVQRFLRNPPDLGIWPFKIDGDDVHGIMTASLAAQTLLPVDGAIASFGLPVTNIVAWGSQTLGADGDGTVPLTSGASIRGDDVRTMFLPIGAYPIANIPLPHPHLWSAPPLVQLFAEVLQGSARLPFVAAAVDANDFSNPSSPAVKIRITAIDENGEALPDCTVRFKRKRFPLAGSGTFEISRSDLPVNVNGTPFHRMEIEIRLDGGKRKEVVIFHVR